MAKLSPCASIGMTKRTLLASTTALSIPWMYLLCAGFIFFVNLADRPAQALPRHQLHQHMTIDEIKSIFQVDSHLQVPDYDVVHVRSIRKRDASTSQHAGSNLTSEDTKEIHISAFGRHYPLRLQRNDHLSRSADRLKVFVAEMHTDGNLNLTEVHFPGNTSDIGDVYQDDVSGAAVLVHHGADGSLLLDGTIGSGLAIRPAPASVLAHAHHHDVTVAPSALYPDDEIFMDNELPPDSPNEKQLRHDALEAKIAAGGRIAPRSKSLHIVYERKQSDSSANSDYMFMEPDRLPPGASSRQKREAGDEEEDENDEYGRRRREAPVAVWPEILVIVDYDTYNMHGSNNMDIKKYFISFWNGVDLRYKLLGTPKVRISLAGIIISKGRDATPYLENNRVGGNAVDSAGALTELGKYLFRERRLPTYDIAVVVTKLDLCRREYTLGACNKGTAGFAYVGGACVVNKRLEKVNSVAIIEDTGGFSGIIVAAHEVGHLLGAVHDGSPPPSYLGGPGAEHCRWEDGYIMSDLRHTERGFKWSLCSVQQFKHFLNGDTAKCLYNIPHEDDELPRLLPGKLLSLDSQCRKDRGTSACFKDDRVCAQLFCFDSRSGYCVSYRPAAEGSPCGDGQYCINGRCVAENENVIPDYSRVSEIRVPKPDGATSNNEVSAHDALDDSNAAAAETPPDGFANFPRRTAVLDNEDDISVVVDGRHSSDKEDSAPSQPSIKRTSLLNDASQSGQYSPDPVPSDGDTKRTSELDHIHADESPASPPAHGSSDMAERGAATLDRLVPSRSNSLGGGHMTRRDPARSGTTRLRSTFEEVRRNLTPAGRYAEGGEPPVNRRREVAHLRRTSHLDVNDDLLAFSEDTSTPSAGGYGLQQNAVTKHDDVRQPFPKLDLQEDDLNSEIGCRDIMRELAGGLTCKQFLRRFGDRYCNHHYIIANCCSSRKIICDI